MDLCKILFNILASLLILMGLLLASVGFYGPSLHAIDESPLPFDDGSTKYDDQLEVAFYGLGVTGLGLVGLAVLGMIAVNMDFRFLIFIFSVAVIILAVAILAFSGLAFLSVYLRATAFKNYWRPKMEKFDPKNLVDLDFASVHALQSKHGCCGLSGEDVYAKSDTLPATCCYAVPLVRIFDPGAIIDSLTNKLCNKEKVKELGKVGCDVALNADYNKMGKVVAYGSLIVGLYMISLVITACNIHKA